MTWIRLECSWITRHDSYLRWMVTEPQFVILGATGDLTGRYLLPALVGLHRDLALPVRTPILCIGQEAWDLATFRSHVAERLARHASKLPIASRDAVLGMLEYRSADVTDQSQLGAALGAPTAPLALYLALPPAVGAAVLRALASLALPEGSRVVAEKPFGTDQASAQALNRLLAKSFPERAVFRMDHFLGKQTVQNVLGLRFANRVFEYLWNRDHIERVEITWDETVSLEGRAGYYDRAGALRDMIQNHLLQLLCLVGIEPPTGFDEARFRDRKADLLRAVRTMNREEVVSQTIRARYAAGQTESGPVPSYVNEPGVDPARMTETFAQVTLFVDNWRWAGVPFVLRTGKALEANRHEIAIYFRPIPHMMFARSAPNPNVLRLSLNPDRVALGLNINGPGDPFDLETATLETELAPHAQSAYARLLLEVFAGNAVLSIRGDEAEECWRIVEPIVQAWAGGAVPLGEYPAGSNGPVMKPPSSSQ
ncbi:MAG: glucose-6-phosphate dehydrogenase [Gemmataceae bacterium]|nr:glucose-6-phosphate dehydrogenase [Gemmataceae bacterium]